MASILASDFSTKPLHMSAYGNAWTDDYSVTAKADADDKLYLGIIPGGIRVNTMRIINGAAGTGATVKIGFEPVDSDGPTADDDAFYATGTSVAAAGTSDSKFQPVTFDKPVKIVATVEVAFTNSITLGLVVNGKCVGIG